MLIVTSWKPGPPYRVHEHGQLPCAGVLRAGGRYDRRVQAALAEAHEPHVHREPGHRRMVLFTHAVAAEVVHHLRLRMRHIAPGDHDAVSHGGPRVPTRPPGSSVTGYTCPS